MISFHADVFLRGISFFRSIFRSRLFSTSFAASLLLHAAIAPAQDARIESSRFRAAFKGASLVTLTDAQGRQLVEPGLPVTAASVIVDKKKTVARNTATQADNQLLASDFPGQPGSNATLTVRWDEESGDLVVTQKAEVAKGGLESTEWYIGYIPLEYNMLIAGGNGEFMTKDTPYKTRNFNYLMGWDAQLIVFEGKGHGFYLWCDDPHEKQKAISVNRTEKGWVITCRSTNDAPFDGKRTLQSQNWRINTYEGDWRVPASRYRQWAEKAWDVKPLAKRTPTWMKEIRTFVFMEQLETPLLDELARQLDPAQTVIYLNHWRKQQFDREAPSYTDPNLKLKPVMDRAHELGFRVILHTNFWGVSPDHPLMAELAQHQVVGTDGKKMRYENLRQNPPLFLNYINPASKRWREIYIGTIKEMVKITGADGVHLDQNFHSHNDMNGLIDGLTFNEGLLALHDELKTALPQVAISGEGLNEMTYRRVDFAQRHVWSAMGGTIDRAALSVSHPISSYLFAPYLRLYGWLGFPTPQENPQLFAAWRENFKDWGTFPTIRYYREISPEALHAPNGFYRQALDEAQFFQRNRVEPDLEGEWSHSTAFPFKTADGKPLLWTKDRCMISQGKEISRTVTGVGEVTLPGTIDGCLYFDRQRIFGLNPDLFYAYFDTPRDLKQTHIEQITDGLRAYAARITSDFLLFSTSQAEVVLTDLIKELPGAVCSVRLFDGEELKEQGGINGNHAARLNGAGTTLALTPPSGSALSADLESTAVVQAKALGDVVATYEITVPAIGQTWFRSAVGMDGRAVRTMKTDGMTFTVRAVADGNPAEAAATARDDSRVDLNLDLSPFAGKKIRLELIAGAGAAKDATEDRGIWYRPQIVQMTPLGANPTRVANVPADWDQVVGDTKPVAYQKDGSMLLISPHQGRVVVGKLPFVPAQDGMRLVSTRSTLTPSMLWGWPVPAGLPLPSLSTEGDDLVAALPVRTKLLADWLLALPHSPIYFKAEVTALPAGPGTGVMRAKLAANDKVIADVILPPKGNVDLKANLSEWAGQNVVLSLILEGRDYRGESKIKVIHPQMVESIPAETWLHWNFEKQEPAKPVTLIGPESDARKTATLTAQEAPPTTETDAPKTAQGGLTKCGTFSAEQKQFLRSNGLGKALVIPMRSSFTLEAWVNPSAAGKDGSGYICSNRDPGRGTTGYSLTMNRRGGKLFPSFAVTAGGNSVTALSSNALTADAWHHIAGVRHENGTVTLYIDGEKAADSGAKTQPAEIDSYVNLTVGRTPHLSGVDTFFSGKIAELRLTSGALSPDKFLR